MGTGPLVEFVLPMSWQESDMTGVVVGLDLERTKVVDFSTFLFMDTEKITFKRPVLESDMAGFVKPYTAVVSCW